MKMKLASNSVRSEYMSSEEGTEYDTTALDMTTTNETIVPGERIAKEEFDSVKKWKLVVTLSLFAAAAVVVCATYFSLSIDERDEFESAFEHLAGTASGTAHLKARTIIHAFKSRADTITSHSLSPNINWPFVTLPNVEVRFHNLQYEAFTEFVGFSPIVEARERDAWETFTVKNQYWISESQQTRYESQQTSSKSQRNATSSSSSVMMEMSDPFNATQKLEALLTKSSSMKSSSLLQSSSLQSILSDIHVVDHKHHQYVVDESWGPYLPMWQTSPPPQNLSIVNYNLLSNPMYAHLFEAAKVSGRSVVSGLIDGAGIYDFLDPVEHHSMHSKHPYEAAIRDWEHPHSVIVQPIYDSFDEETHSVVGILQGLLSWDDYFKDLLPEGLDGVTAVVTNSCNGSFTYEIEGYEAYFLGMGDHHDPRFNKNRIMVDFYEFNGHGEGEAMVLGLCHYELYFYPSIQFQSRHESAKPEIFTATVALVFFLTFVTFQIFNYCVSRHEKKLSLTAEKTNAVVASLFPKNVRERVMKDVEEQVQQVMKGSELGGNSFFHRAPKLRLKSYLNDENVEHGNDNQATFFNTKPIADLFPSVTVLFADIVGFTAWSSVREPSQVFQLLETLYYSFDNIAKRRRVFKVETVGDCYVAATGLPDPRKDHALVMARFARECMHSMSILTKKLEETLGPDTGDLGMRFGLHSGPVTAGVLRGEKSRFQLFGDTMNTASRIETTGSRGRIHISQETADLIIVSGKSKWLTPRSEKVTLKGKGQVQTFWVSAVKDNSVTDESSETSRQNPEGIFPEPLWANSNLGENIQNDSELDEKMQRLVKWNVDQLINLLKPVVARRNCLRRKSNPDSLNLEAYDASIVLESTQTVLEEVKEIIELPTFDMKTFKSIEDPTFIDLSSTVVNQLHDYVTNICKMYRESNPFHNFEHASHVTMSVCKLLSRITAPEDVEYDERDLLTVGGNSVANFAAALHDHTYGITSDPLTQFSVAFAALIHDVDHTGVPNAQLIKEDMELGKRYKNKSVAEQNSVDLAWDLLMSDSYTDLRNIIYSNEQEFSHFRQLTVNSVMATDIVDRGLKELRDKRWAKAFSSDGMEPKSQKELDDDRNRKATIVIEHLIQASDVAHTMQHWHVYRKWNERFFREMYTAYKTGRSEFDPSKMWYKGEIGFFDFYIIPLAKKLKDCGVFGVSHDEYLNFALMNRAEWVSKGEQVVAEMVETMEKELNV